MRAKWGREAFAAVVGVGALVSAGMLGAHAASGDPAALPCTQVSIVVQDGQAQLTGVCPLPTVTVTVAPSSPVSDSAAPDSSPAPVTPPPSDGGYPVHTNIVATTFWVGELFNKKLADGSQMCSTYDSQWAMHWSGMFQGKVPSSEKGCAGASWGGCDGVASGTTYDTFQCKTEKRTKDNGYYPSRITPAENPFYLDLPFDDLNDKVAFAERCQVIPWAAADPAHCADKAFSYMKNAWVQITGPNGATCYGQIEDAGPSSGSKYHDDGYVFGANDPRPLNKKFSGDKSQGAGMDVSPALNGCLGFAELDGDNDHINWRFIDAADVPDGPWLRTVTTSGVN